MSSNYNTKIKWYTILEIVDLATGELLTKSEYERRNMKVIFKEQKNEFKQEKHGKYGIRRIYWLCGENPQQRLFD